VRNRPARASDAHPRTVVSATSGTTVAGWDYQTTANSNGGTAAAASPNTPKLFKSNAGVGTSGLSTQSKVTQQEIGTTITIKPLIGTDGTVQLDIKQDISEVTGTVQIDNNTQYIIGKRKTTSYVTSRSGQILVLAGYQKNKDSRNTSRLGPIPIIGDLLGGRTNAKNRIELVIFLRPVVLTNTPTDNLEAMKRVDTLEQKELVRQRLDPSYVPPKKSIIEKAFGN
jgi:general secretion pathway protein D